MRMRSLITFFGIVLSGAVIATGLAILDIRMNDIIRMDDRMHTFVVCFVFAAVVCLPLGFASSILTLLRSDLSALQIVGFIAFGGIVGVFVFAPWSSPKSGLHLFGAVTGMIVTAVLLAAVRKRRPSPTGDDEAKQNSEADGSTT